MTTSGSPAIGRRIVCAPHLPDACHHQALVPAYGWTLARLARAQLVDRRRSAGTVEIVYWEYRPTLGRRDGAWSSSRDLPY